MTHRRALAEGSIRMDRKTLQAILDRRVEKGDVLAVARIAAVGGAKRTSDIVPLCHPLPLHGVTVEIEVADQLPGLRLTAETTTEARTGVEMEALCAVSAGLLAVYDMCKSMDRAMELGAVRLLEKDGGRSGMWRRREPDSRRHDGSTAS